VPALAFQRCLHHSEREAVARCPECARFFCRECIAEHEERVVCAGCLQRLSRPRDAAAPARRFRIAPVAAASSALAGLLVAWIGFYLLGRMLLALPSDFHAATLWRQLSSGLEFAAPPPKAGGRTP
jgi:hypothetical protein